LKQIKLVAIDEWLDRIERVERTHQARAPKREEGRTPDVLELEELQHLLSKLGPRERMLVLLDAATGLRVSELLVLRWEDVDFENLELRVIRSIWHHVVGDCKTEASAKPVSPKQLHGGRSLPLEARHKRIDWHTFRHIFGTLLKANGEDVKTVRELLRHANSRITLDVYTQAVSSIKRAAQSKVVRMMVPGGGSDQG